MNSVGTYKYRSMVLNVVMFHYYADSDKEDDFFEDDDDMFSRLEESRVQLEQELGEETFLKAYKTVQVQLIYTLDTRFLTLCLKTVPSDRCEFTYLLLFLHCV